MHALIYTALFLLASALGCVIWYAIATGGNPFRDEE